MQLAPSPPVDADFDSLLFLACQICETPAAAVIQSGVDGSFCKAKVGFKPDETPSITSFSICIPLISEEHRLFGHLCMNKKQEEMTEAQNDSLKHISRSITTMMAIKSRLEGSAAFYENILNKLPTDVVVFDTDHRYLFVNPGAISKEEYRKFIIGKDDYEYVAYRNRDISVAHSRRAKFLEVKRTGKEIRWEDSLPDPDGNVITHLRRLYPVYDEKGELSFVIGFGIDITDRKVMEEKQAALVKTLSTRNTQLIDFCSIVSHNLRAPLVNMSMLVDFIESSEEADEQMVLISKLRPVIDNLHSTFNELVESIQVRQDTEIKTENVCLKECLKRTMEGLQTEIGKLDARIETDFNEVPVINYPPQYLNSIIHNLVSNSLKYHFPGRRPEILLATRKEGDKVILSVRDNGLGIDLVKHRENFFKIGKVFHRHPNARGFGLYMTKTHVEALGGRIWVESVPGEGAVFFVEFANRIKQAQ